MLFSVFTPTHAPQYLLDAYHSLQQQDVNWEWVLVPNGACEAHHLPREITADPRVRVVPWRLPEKLESPFGIGLLKQYACQQCRGDVFCELDHDDLLVPGILAQVGDRVRDGAGFVFSDSAHFKQEDLKHVNVPFNTLHGWEHYPVTVQGQNYIANRNFEVTPRSLCDILYAPDHIRCWTRDAYFKVGGHNPDLVVGDDHELICRAYIDGIEFGYTGTCGYLYRRHDDRTSEKQMADIGIRSGQTRDKYLYRLLDTWCRRHDYNYLDIDLRKPSPQFALVEGRLIINAKTDSVAVIRAYDVLQYMANDQIIPSMNELYRVLQPGGWLCLAAPSTDGRGAFMPYYKSLWNEYMLLFFCESEHRRHYAERMPGGPLLARFQPVRLFTAFPTEGWLPAPYYNYKNAKVSYVYADLCAIKGQRQPGLVDC